MMVLCVNLGPHFEGINWCSSQMSTTSGLNLKRIKPEKKEPKLHHLKL